MCHTNIHKHKLRHKQTFTQDMWRNKKKHKLTLKSYKSVAPHEIAVSKCCGQRILTYIYSLSHTHTYIYKRKRITTATTKRELQCISKLTKQNTIELISISLLYTHIHRFMYMDM